MGLDELRTYLAENASTPSDEATKRAAVVVETSAEETFLGVGFHQDIVEQIADKPPLERLHSANLDVYCVLIEEVSHFTLLTHRAATGRGVSRLELELQAEIDKVVLCAATLERHYGSPSLAPLVRSLFDQSVVVSVQDGALYETANRVAARFWHKIAARWEDRLPQEAAIELRNTLRSIFHSSFTEKLTVLEGSPQRIIKRAA